MTRAEKRKGRALALTCEACGGAMRFRVRLMVEAPLTMVPKLTKEILRSRHVVVQGADWTAMVAFCPACTKKEG